MPTPTPTPTTRTSTKMIDRSVRCKSFRTLLAFSIRRHLKKLHRTNFERARTQNGDGARSELVDQVTGQKLITVYQKILKLFRILFTRYPWRRRLLFLIQCVWNFQSVRVFFYSKIFASMSFWNRKIRGMKKTKTRSKFHSKVSLWLQRQQSKPLSIWFADNKFFRQK